MINEAWGIKPVLFEIYNIKITSYGVFMSLALISGFLVYMYYLTKEGKRGSNAIFIAIFSLSFGTIGAKLPIILLDYNKINNNNAFEVFLSGRTIVGGLLGGLIGTILAKKIFNIKEKMGNQLAIPVAVGMAVGRIGCFLTGCCYGKETILPWGVNFGDGLHRHPTQIYEIVFDLTLVAYLLYRRKKPLMPGQLFKIFLTWYMSFRFLLEYIRTERIVFLGFTAFQLLCITTLIYINKDNVLNYLEVWYGRKEKLN